jgi:hypothetical protein
MSEKLLLTWVTPPGTHGQSHDGRAGGIRLFSYTWDSSKAHPGEPWVMYTDLPGASYVGRKWRSGSEIDLQETAERILAAWLGKVTDSAKSGTRAVRPRLTDGHLHEASLHSGWLGHDGHRVHRHEMGTGRTEWEKP